MLFSFYWIGLDPGWFTKAHLANAMPKKNEVFVKKIKLKTEGC